MSEDSEELAKLWDDKGMKELLKERIKEKVEYKSTEDINKKKKMLSDKAIIEQFWKEWILIDEKKEPYKKLSHHPSLTLKDFDEINLTVMKYRERQFYWSLGFSALTLGIYSGFFKRNRIFYNFFRKESKFRGVKTSKKILGCFGVFWSWLLILNYFFDKQIPFDLKDKKLFDKYHIEFER